MPVATEPIYARTLLGLWEEQMARNIGNGSHAIPIVIVCNARKCKNAMTNNTEKRVLVLDEFRCMACFANLVRNQTAAFGVSDKPTDKEIEGLLKPYDPSETGMKPFATNLFKLKRTPRFVSI